MDIKTYRVKQYNLKPVTVVMVDGVPICTVRGKRSLSNILAYLQGYDVEISDGKIRKRLEELRNV